ncbi:MAG: EutP/PduV family microcompartment system protein [Sporomusaceae bacterium]|nr:EutP/PduV family microcompartment system protein [Sporomusaceae bacterium]
MNQVMFVGAVGAGKTSLIHALNKDSKKAEKTQSFVFTDGAIDTPGEYAQMPRFYSALMVTAAQASLIVIVQDSRNTRPTLPPGFAGMFSRDSIGVITKIDSPDADRDKARIRLLESGVKGPIFPVSAFTGEGIEELMDYIFERRCSNE